MKIVYCTDSICYMGGVELVTIIKANALAEIKGNEVFIVVADNESNELITPLSPKVHLVDLHVNYNCIDGNNRAQSMRSGYIKRRLHKHLLGKKLHEIQPDIVVSVGRSEKYFLPSMRGNWKTIRELHLTANYRSFVYNSFWQKLLAKIMDIYEYDCRIWNYDKIVLLTQEDKRKHWKDNDKIEVIPNPITFKEPNVPAQLEAKRIVAVGRLEAQKNFSSLLQVFELVAAKHADWMLEIYGDGSLKDDLMREIIQLGLERNVILMGYTDRVREKLMLSSCLVVSSLFEGFSLAILEAMSCGLPVVSYLCPCGPSDLIDEGETGFLVPQGDEQAMADRICRLIEDDKLRKEMGHAAKKASEQYRLDKIIPKWMNLFQDLAKKE